MKIAVKIHGIAAVPNDAMAVSSFFIKSKGHSIHGGMRGELPRMHLLRGFRAENLGVSIFSILEMRDHEMSHIDRRR